MNNYYKWIIKPYEFNSYDNVKTNLVSFTHKDEVKHLDLLTEDECKIIAEAILAREDEIKSIGPDKYTNKYSDGNSLTGRFWCYNFLKDETIGSILKPKLKKLLGSCSVQCWANTFREGEGISEHIHNNRPLHVCPLRISANIFIYGDPTIGTYYNGIKHENKIGQIAIFSSKLKHYVPKNNSGDIRISMALDIYDINSYSEDFLLKSPERFVKIT